MNHLALHLERFLREYLPRDRRASVHTCDSYAYAFQLLVTFAARRLKRQPSLLELEQLDAPLILAFLEHIETERHNLPQSRNARLVAIKAFFRFLEYQLPSCLDQSRRIHAIPAKKTHVRNVCAVQPILPAIDSIAAHRDGYSCSCSLSILTARSRTSGAYLTDFPMTPILSGYGASGNPGAIQEVEHA